MLENLKPKRQPKGKSTSEILNKRKKNHGKLSSPGRPPMKCSRGVSTKKMNILFPEDLHKRLKAEAAMAGITMNDFIVDAVRANLENYAEQ